MSVNRSFHTELALSEIVQAVTLPPGVSAIKDWKLRPFSGRFLHDSDCPRESVDRRRIGLDEGRGKK